jgi:DNA-binding NarL/FixJ family response regulator
MSTTIRIILVDDHDLIRESWKQLLGTETRFKVIEVYKNGVEAVEQVINLLPDIVLMDINMTPITGFEATEKILRSFPSAKIIGISVNNNPRYSHKMLSLGAKGFVTKTSTLDELKKAILKVYNGEIYVCEEIRKKEKKEE